MRVRGCGCVGCVVCDVSTHIHTHMLMIRLLIRWSTILKHPTNKKQAGTTREEEELVRYILWQGTFCGLVVVCVVLVCLFGVGWRLRIKYPPHQRDGKEREKICSMMCVVCIDATTNE